MDGFVCTPLQDVQSEDECEENDLQAKDFYHDDTIHNRTQDCANYFNIVKTVAHWPVSSFK